MTRRLDLDRLVGTAARLSGPARDAALVEALGWLAPWWLPRETVERAVPFQPAYRAYLDPLSLPVDPGGCWILLVRRDDLPLRPAFLLPLRWREGPADDPHLPLPLRDLADRVRTQLADREDRRWGLWLARPASEEPLDLAALDHQFGASSAWASLAGGLLLARDGLASNPRVWASVAWSEQYGIAQVEGVNEKLDLAAEWQVEQFFAPAQNQPAVADWEMARSAGWPRVTLLAPVSGRPQAGRLLEPYLSELGVEPAEGQSAELAQRYYARVDRVRARDFYWRRLLDPAVQGCRRGIPAECRATHAVTVASLEPAPVALGPLALQVGYCLLLYRPETGGRIDRVRRQVRERLEANGIEVRESLLLRDDRAGELEEVAGHLACFAGGLPPERLAIDLTPGYKSLTLALEAVGPPGSWLLYCRHVQTGPDNRVQPGSERYDCWRKV